MVACALLLLDIFRCPEEQGKGVKAIAESSTMRTAPLPPILIYDIVRQVTFALAYDQTNLRYCAREQPLTVAADYESAFPLEWSRGQERKQRWRGMPFGGWLTAGSTEE